MDAFISRKRRRISPTTSKPPTSNIAGEDDSTDFKLATLASLHPFIDQEVVFEALLASDGSVELASEFLRSDTWSHSPRKRSKGSAVIGYQSSLASFKIKSNSSSTAVQHKPLTKKGKTLHLYSPEDVVAHTPCTIIHNFLPQDKADALLLELLDEVPTFERERFKLFDRVVESPHTSCFYVDSGNEAEKHKTEYYYYGGRQSDVRQSLPHMLEVSQRVQETVNQQINTRIKEFYPKGKKLQYQSPEIWKPNAAFVNCYDGGGESDQLTYLGPRAIIGSLSLGVAREFRVRKVIVRDEEQPTKSNSNTKVDSARADAEGQISIHLPHNSLLVMHAEMQEEWKHSIAPAPAIDPHPVAKNKRLNITYRYYKDDFHPRFTLKCRCGIPTVLRCVQRKKENRGRYMWMCHGNYNEGSEGCAFFQWAEFDNDGNPPWSDNFMKDAGGNSGRKEDSGELAGKDGY